MTNNLPSNQSPYSVFAQQQQQKIQIQKPIAIVPCKPAVAQIPQPPQPKVKEEAEVKSNILKRCLENKVDSIMKPSEEGKKPLAKIIKFVRIMGNFGLKYSSFFLFFLETSIKYSNDKF